MALGILLAAIVVIVCVWLNSFSQKFGIPMLLAFIVLGMLFGSDGILRIPFENYNFSEQICSVALIFIMFYGGFGTNWSQAKPVAVKAALLSTVGVVLTAGLTGLFCYFVLRFELLESLLVGAVLSSTDAASVFSILRSKKLGLKEHTDSMLELESGSNDPSSYMLTAVLLTVMDGRRARGFRCVDGGFAVRGRHWRRHSGRLGSLFRLTPFSLRNGGLRYGVCHWALPCCRILWRRCWAATAI